MTNVGEKVTLKVRNNLYPKRHLYSFHVPEYNTYSGVVVASPKWAANAICLSTGEPKFKFRVIQKDSIVGYEDQVAPKNTIKTWQVKGSKDNVYTVTEDHGRWSCTCTGFEFRHNCKHIADLRK